MDSIGRQTTAQLRAVQRSTPRRAGVTFRPTKKNIRSQTILAITEEGNELVEMIDDKSLW